MRAMPWLDTDLQESYPSRAFVYMPIGHSDPLPLLLQGLVPLLLTLSWFFEEPGLDPGRLLDPFSVVHDHHLQGLPLLLRKNSCLLVSSLAAQNRESRIAQFPESLAWNRQKFHSKKQKNESNRSKVESQEIDSESPSESHPINA